ncbi:JAB domain-containing protein [Anaeromyxobacter oryzae]|uniref:DNA repair protein RadC n=1 Tax=Anaeromyxobacter oryzae TaxID=2918170 RepID=A0ABM7WTE8_9BACT|nr:DNA repair protein RadC [Anaeromyxobacter oryzae]BDG02763.1 DNA repair protein RadC [Anaeromyxobacter oryzae]
MALASDSSPAPVDLPRERLLAAGPRALSDAELIALVLGAGAGRLSARATALGLLEALPVAELAWAPPDVIAAFPGIGLARAAAVSAAFELGRRGAWAPPRRGERCLDPGRVFELMRHAAHGEREAFHVVLLDVRGRLLRAVQVAEGSLTQCPVSPRDALRPAVREGAHGIVFVHNHPSGDPSPSPDDADLTERLRAAADLVGVLARDHVIVATGGYYSFVEAGRWRR